MVLYKLQFIFKFKCNKPKKKKKNTIAKKFILQIYIILMNLFLFQVLDMSTCLRRTRQLSSYEEIINTREL
jgi:hypothetical protein